MMNTQALQIVDESTWPSHPPTKHFTPQVLIHHQEQHTQEQVSEIAKLI